MAKKAAEEKVEKAAKTEPEVVEVMLVSEHPGTHNVYLKDYRVEFEKGVAKVPAEVADELRKLGIIK